MGEILVGTLNPANKKKQEIRDDEKSQSNEDDEDDKEDWSFSDPTFDYIRKYKSYFQLQVIIPPPVWLSEKNYWNFSLLLWSWQRSTRN